jgi:NADH-quinone oxidoreductase subunit N
MPITIPTVTVMPVLPQIIVAVAALIMLILNVFVPPERTQILAVLTLAGLGASAAAVFAQWGETGTVYNGMMATDNLSLYACLVLLAGAALTVLLSWDYVRSEDLSHGEFYTLILLAVAGMMLLAASSDLLMVFLSLETLSLALYILVGFARQRLTSEEAALKYFLLGAFASAFLLYGIALTYGATATTNFAQVAAAVASAPLAHNVLLLTGLVLLLVGFGFKLALVPFQMWTPDVYQGAPTPVTAFMSVATKAAAFVALLRFASYAIPSLSSEWAALLAIIAVLTMTLGNVVAIKQSNIKRMLAYSSIAQAGYILIGIIAGGEQGQSAVLFYLLTYTFMNVGAFAVVEALERRDEGLEIRDYAGLGARAPALAAAMALFMFSLAGFPPTAGFFAKFYVFNSAVQAGYAWLAVVGVLNSLVGVVYYVGIVVVMYMREPGASPVALSVTRALSLVVLIAALGTLVFGLIPSPVLDLARQSLAMLP